MKLIDDGVLPSRKVGSHRRITLADLLAYHDDMVARTPRRPRVPQLRQLRPQAPAPRRTARRVPTTTRIRPYSLPPRREPPQWGRPDICSFRCYPQTAGEARIGIVET
ncbi:MAG: helix-turn-helix domain-containing protein, partial [Actinomycetota bacterium]|nr:helix-turn-helix domain-containing protein [Actinomycetota bacterium]